MTRLCTCVALVIALGCTEKKSDGRPASQPSRPSQPPPDDAERPAPCDTAPDWTGLESRCQHADHVYAVGAGERIGNLSLRIHVAGDRARAALIDASTATLMNSEVLDMMDCGAVAWALARRPVSEGDPALPACDGRIKDRADPLPGCPAWSTALATREGERVSGVGYVIGVKNAQMARSMASNRAVSEQRKTLGLKVTRSEDGSVSMGTTSGVMALQEDAEVATCGTVTVAKVTSKVLK